MENNITIVDVDTDLSGNEKASAIVSVLSRAGYFPTLSSDSYFVECVLSRITEVSDRCIIDAAFEAAQEPRFNDILKSEYLSS